MKEERHSSENALGFNQKFPARITLRMSEGGGLHKLGGGVSKRNPVPCALRESNGKEVQSVRKQNYPDTVVRFLR